MWIVTREVERELTSDDCLFEKCVLRDLRRLRLFNRGDDFLNRDESEMQIRAESRNAVDGRIFLRLVVMRQDVLDEVINTLACGLCAAAISIGQIGRAAW